MATGGFDWTIEPVLQIETIRFAVVFGDVQVGDMNFEAFRSVLFLERRLELQQNGAFDVIAIVGGQNVENDFLVLFDAPVDGRTTIKRCQILWKI